MTSDIVCTFAQITYRQLDHWTTFGWIGTDEKRDPGSGVRREWTRTEVRHIGVMATLVRAGLPPFRASELATDALSRGHRVAVVTLAPGVMLVLNLEELGVWTPADRGLAVV